MSHVSFSELKNWDKCAFYHKLMHVDKLKLFKGNEYTAFGTAIHDTCENMLLNEHLEVSDFFLEKYKESLKKLADDDYVFDKKLALDMKEQGLEILPYIKPALNSYFSKYKILGFLGDFIWFSNLNSLNTKLS